MARVERMLDRVQHRGPDDRGVWAKGPVALGHVRLSVLDLSDLGHQPMCTADGMGVLSYNGEVYNFRELRKELERSGIVFRSRTDTEVVLYALHMWGPVQAVSRFNGMFALAYHDLRDGSLWLARDRLGIKPLYLARTATGVVFGSEIKALLAHPEVPCRPDPLNVVTQIIRERLDGIRTPFDGIEALRAGTLSRWGRSEESFIYFDLLRDVDPRRVLDGDHLDFTEHLRRFEAGLGASVDLHLLSDAPLAVMCSGGLDSGLITALARERKPDVVAYVADVEGVGESEAARAARVCQHLGVELRTVRVDRDTYFRLWPAAVYANDQPNHFAQSVAAMAVAEAVRKDGFKVLLNGDGADELFGGYSWYVSAHRMWRRRRLRAAWVRDNRLFRRLGRFHHLFKPVDLEELADRPFAQTSTDEGSALADRETCALTDRWELRQAALFRRLDALPRHEDRAFLARSFEDVYVHLGEALRSNDRMAMWQSVEARVPFLENGLIDSGIHLPCGVKYRRRQTKALVRAMAAKRLPRDVMALPKIGFGISDQLWRGSAGLLEGGMVADFLRWSRDEQADIVRRVRRHPRFLFRMLSFEIWARLFVGGETCEQLTVELRKTNDG